jgi:iron complex transport system ATP-binding protein
MSLQTKNLSVHVADFDLLRNINLEIQPGTVTAVVGPNGAGKTSLLRALSGDLAASQGEIVLNNSPLEHWSLQDRAKMLAVLPQTTPLNFPFTANEVVALGRTPHQSGQTKDQKISREVLEVVDGSYLEKRFYTYMSGGEKQRVQLARVLAQVWESSELGDRYLLLDEPTSAFDLSHQLITLDIVRRCAEDGMGILLVLHDLNLAARCADNLVVLEGGQIAAQGKPKTVLSENLLKEVFGVTGVIMENPLTGTPMVIT